MKKAVCLSVMIVVCFIVLLGSLPLLSRDIRGIFVDCGSDGSYILVGDLRDGHVTCTLPSHLLDDDRYVSNNNIYAEYNVVHVRDGVERDVNVVTGSRVKLSSRVSWFSVAFRSLWMHSHAVHHETELAMAFNADVTIAPVYVGVEKRIVDIDDGRVEFLFQLTNDDIDYMMTKGLMSFADIYDHHDHKWLSDITLYNIIWPPTDNFGGGLVTDNMLQ